MTEPLYLSQTTDRTFEATVERVVDDRIVLDRTLFYPEGGGQPADRGRIRADDREWRVVDVQKRDTIYHHLEPIEDADATPEGPPEAGTAIAGELDWERRHAHMRYHTAQHLLSALLLTEYEAATTGNQLYADRARLDCEYDRFDEAALAAIESGLNDLIDAALPVRWYELDREEAEDELDPERTRIHLLPDSITEIRIVEIGDPEEPYDRVACAGTHVSNTEEMGRLEVTGRETAGSGEERIRFRLEGT